MRPKLLIIPLASIIIIGAMVSINTNKRPSVQVRPIDNISWRERIQYTTVSKLSKMQRRKIYNETISELALADSPIVAYENISHERNLSVEDVKNIIGEGIALNWSLKDSIDLNMGR